MRIIYLLSLKKWVLALTITAQIAYSQSLVECEYELHKAENEFNAVLSVGYTHQGLLRQGEQALNQIAEYPHEIGEIERFMSSIIKKIKNFDEKRANAYLLELLRAKNENYKIIFKKCEKLSKTSFN